MLSMEWLIGILILSQIFLYAAREPMRRVLRSLGQTVGGSLRLISTWLRNSAADLDRRSHELILDSGREHTEAKIEEEFRRIKEEYSKNLEEFPSLNRRMHDLVQKVEGDYESCGASQPAPPGWSEAVKVMSSMPRTDEKMVQRVLSEIHKSAVEGEKRALSEYRTTSAKRHKILGGLMPYLKSLKEKVGRADKSFTHALESATRIDGYMKKYEKIRKKDGGARRVLAWSAFNSFLVSAIVIAVALGGAFINFQLIALPMSELVPAGNRLMGIPVPTIAALVIVLMEIAAGIFLLEMMGITNLFPQLVQLARKKRRLILGISLLGLFLLASIESSLAVLREQIVEAESVLKRSLAGVTDRTVAQPVGSMIPMIGQAVLGFILPWIIAMVAIPLEMMIHTAGPVLLIVLSAFARLFAQVFRLSAHLVRYCMRTVEHLYDAYIAIPVWISRMGWGGNGKSPAPVPGEERMDEPMYEPAAPEVNRRQGSVSGSQEVVS